MRELAIREQRCRLLFWALFTLLVALPFLGETTHGQAILSVVNVAVLLTAVVAVGRYCTCVDSVALPDSTGDGGRRDVRRHTDRAPYRRLSDRG